jgi:hypothetical protein
MAVHYHFVLEKAIFNSSLPPLAKKPSAVAAMCQIMIHQFSQSLTLSAVPLGLFQPGKRAQTGKVPAPGANVDQLKFESLMFDAGKNTGQGLWHRAPVENF